MTVHPLPVVRSTLVSTHAGLDAAMATAGREVLVARTDELSAPLRRVDHENLRRGVRYRILLPEDVRSNAVLTLRLGRLAAHIALP